MSTRATTLAQGFSQKLMIAMYDKSVLDSIVNRDYEGEINGVGSILNILDFDKVSEKDYAGSPLSADNLTENNGQLTIEKKKSFYWKEKDLDNFLSYIKNPHPTVVEQAANERNRNMDLYALGKFASVGAGNRVGTDVNTGTVAVDVSGNVTLSGAAVFSSAMIGRGFKAAGHSKFYRVLSVADTTHCVIQDDLDDVVSQYTGGVIGAGATYVCEAVTATSITTSNLLQVIAAGKLKLDQAEKNGFHAVPDDQRWAVLPPEFFDLVVRAQGIALHVDAVYANLIGKGYMGELLGMQLFKSNRLSGDNTNGYHILLGHPGWLTFAEKVITARMEEDLIGDFGAAYKDLFVYGGKVKDARRHFAAEVFATFSI